MWSATQSIEYEDPSRSVRFRGWSRNLSSEPETHTHTHTERERERDRQNKIDGVMDSCTGQKVHAQYNNRCASAKY